MKNAPYKRAFKYKSIQKPLLIAYKLPYPVFVFKLTSFFDKKITFVCVKNKRKKQLSGVAKDRVAPVVRNVGQIKGSRRLSVEIISGNLSQITYSIRSGGSLVYSFMFFNVNL